MRMSRLSLVVSWIAGPALTASLAFAAGCGGAPAPSGGQPPYDDIFRAAGPNEFILLTARGVLVSADMDPDRVRGPDVHLGVQAEGDGQAIRGIAFKRTVSVTVKDQGALGVVGAAPLELTVARADAGFRARGLLAGAASDYRLDERSLTGVIGRCSYDLTRAGRLYRGARSCEGKVQHVRVLLPRGLATWSDAALATALGLLLGA